MPILSNKNPVGSIIAKGSENVPSGYLLCDGSALSRTVYANLFNIIGTTWGEGDGSTTFNLPSMQGWFQRGFDAGTGRDPDAASRGPTFPGGNSGNAVATYQGDQYRAHQHYMTLACWWGNRNGSHGGWSSNDGYQGYYGHGVSAYGGNETRPNNAYVKFCIKY